MTDWIGLLKDSLVKPRSAAARVLALPLATQQLVEIAALTAVLSALLSSVSFQAKEDGARVLLSALLAQPLLLALFQFLLCLVIATLMDRLGRAFQGKGDFRGALALTVWFNIVSILIQIGISIAIVLVPPLAILLLIFLVVWFFWALSAFSAELHGFVNAWRVFGGIFVTLIVLSFALNVVFLMMGIAPPEMGN